MKTLATAGATAFAALALASTTAAQQSPSAPPAATAPAATTPPVATKKAPDPDRIICHTEEETGSRLGGHKTCMTKRQWDEVNASSRDAMSNAQTSAGFLVPPTH